MHLSDRIFGIVDRFEGDVAVIEIDGATHDVPRAQVAEDVKENDVVERIDGRWVRNGEATNQRAEQIRKLMDSVWED